MERPEKAKSPHGEVNYEEESKRRGKTCSRCEHFIDADPARCETVASPISSEGWCERFQIDPRKLSLQEYREYREKGDGKRPERDADTEAYYVSRGQGEESDYES